MKAKIRKSKSDENLSLTRLGKAEKENQVGKLQINFFFLCSIIVLN